MLRRLFRDTTAASAIEYAIIAAMISVAAIGAFLALGNQSSGQMASVNTAYENAN